MPVINTHKLLDVPDAPPVPGLVFRGFAGESDFPRMLAVINGSKWVDGVERNDTLEDIRRNYSHLTHSNPETDMIFAEVDGQVVAYGRVEWNVNDAGEWLGLNLAFSLPEWRRKGIGRCMLRYNENRLRQIAADQAAAQAGDPVVPAHREKFFELFCSDTETAKLALILREGYVAVRHEQLMVRPDLEDIPDAPMPPGLDVRDVQPEHLRAIWEAGAEAFRDHWGFIPPGEEDYKSWLDDRNFNPALWRVAWDGDQVAGMVQSYINADENREYNRLRGWTEGICVRRPWRKQGLARSLLVQSLHRVKAFGMTEAALTVDTQNLSGAFRIYESVGFKPVRRMSNYRKPLTD